MVTQWPQKVWQKVQEKEDQTSELRQNWPVTIILKYLQIPDTNIYKMTTDALIYYYHFIWWNWSSWTKHFQALKKEMAPFKTCFDIVL